MATMTFVIPVHDKCDYVPDFPNPIIIVDMNIL